MLQTTLREEILARRNFGESGHSPILMQFGGINFGEKRTNLNLVRINFGDLLLLIPLFQLEYGRKVQIRRNNFENERKSNLARINFGEWRRKLILAGSNFGEFERFLRQFAKFAKISCRQNFFS